MSRKIGGAVPSFTDLPNGDPTGTVRAVTATGKQYRILRKRWLPEDGNGNLQSGLVDAYGNPVGGFVPPPGGEFYPPTLSTPRDGWNPGVPGGYQQYSSAYTQYCNVKLSIPGSSLVAAADGVTDDSAALNAAISGAIAYSSANNVGVVVYIPTGTYKVVNGIVGLGPYSFNLVTHPWSIILRGDGPTLTKIIGYKAGDVITFSSNSGISDSPLTGNIRGATSFTASSSVDGIIPGMWLVVENDDTSSGAYQPPTYTANILSASNGGGGTTNFVVDDSTGFLNGYDATLSGTSGYDGDRTMNSVTGNTINVSVAFSGTTRGMISSRPNPFFFNYAQTNSQYVRVTSVSGRTVNFSPALNSGFPGAVYSFAFSPPFRSGIEDLFVQNIDDHGGDNIRIIGGQECWIKNVETYQARGIHISLEHCAACSVVDSYVHDFFPLQDGNNAGGGSDYGVDLGFQSSQCLVQNCIAFHCRHSFIMETGAGQGNVIAYNAALQCVNEGLMTTDYNEDTCGHGGQPMYNLWEGNVFPIFRLDSVEGVVQLSTAFRNQISRRAIPATTVACFGMDIQRGNWSNVFAANVFEKLVNTIPPTDLYRLNSWEDVTESIYGSPGQVEATCLFHGNKDLTDNSTVWIPGQPRAFPNSYFLSAKPSWWDSGAFPGIGPDLGTANGGNPAYRKWTSTVGTQPPSALTYSANPVTYGVNVPIKLNAPSLAGYVNSYTISPALPTGLVFDLTYGTVTGTATVTSGAANYTVTAINDNGSTTATLRLGIASVLPPSGLTYSTNPATYTKGSGITNNSPSLEQGVATSYSISPSLSAGLSFSTSTGVISGTPTAVHAFTAYTITATNAGGSTTDVVQITVNDVAPSALTYSSSPASYTEGSPITNNTPSNSGGTVVSYTVSPALPTGLNFNTSTGVISGTPTVTSPNTAYTITATNSGGSTTCTLHVTVTTAGGSSAYITGQSLGTLRSDFNGAVGFAFDVVGSPITITDVGRWIVSGNSRTHTVGVYNSGGTALGTATVNASGAPSSAYAYASLSSPVTLAAGSRYYFFSSETSGGDQWCNDDTTITSANDGGVISLAGSAYSTSGGPNPQISTFGNHLFVPGNFLWHL